MDFEWDEEKPGSNLHKHGVGMLKKAASGVLAILPCSRTGCTLRASTTGAPVGTLQAILRPCWADFFEHSLQLMMAVSSWACMCHGSEIFNSPTKESSPVFLTCCWLFLIEKNYCLQHRRWYQSAKNDRKWKHRRYDPTLNFSLR